MSRIAATFMVLLLLGCPSYDDDLSGTFREDVTDEQFSGEARAIELFRFGDNVQALVRHYKRAADPFQSESRCVWSNAGSLEDGQTTFELPLIDPRERLTIRGTLQSDDLIEFSFSDANSDTAAPSSPFLRANETPNERCDTVPDALMTANFDFDGNAFSPGFFEFQNPVFVVLWLGVEPIESQAFTTFAKTQRKGPWTRLGSSHISEDNLGLRGVLHFFLPPPDPVILTTSGDTRYSIGHFVVVEDTESGEDFEFDPNGDRIAASAIRAGTIPGESPENTNNFGRAILFVEDDLLDLDDALLNRMQGIENVANTSQHFFVVDIFGRNGDIQEVRFSESPGVELNILVTDLYLSSQQIQLPRLIPFTQ